MEGRQSKSGPGCLSLVVVIIALILLAPVIAVLANRHAIEKKYNSVEIVADYYQLLEIANAYDASIDGLLNDVRGAGIEAIALMEDTPRNLEQRGLCYVIHGNDWLGFHTLEEKKAIKALGGEEPDVWDETGIDLRIAYGLGPAMTHLVFLDADLGDRIGQAATVRYTQRIDIKKIDTLTVVSIAGEESLVYETGLGFNTGLPKSLSAMGFRIVPRFRNDRYYSKKAIEDMLDEAFARDEFEKGVIFDGDEVLGYSSNLDAVIIALEGNEAYFGWVEFAKQAGEKNIASALPGLAVRVHSIEDKEMEVYTPTKAIARFQRAVRERGCRLVYLKPFRYPQGPSNIRTTIDYFGAVRKAIEAEGMRIGPPSTFDGDNWRDPSSTWARVLIAFYVFLVATYVIAGNIINRYKWIGVVPVVLTVVVLIVLAIMPGSSVEKLILKLIALLAALAFPILAISELVRTLANPAAKRNVERGLLYWISAIFLSFLGGLIVAALLSERDYMLQIDAFSGVKLSLMLPIVAALILGVRLVMPPDRADKGVVESFRYLFEFPLQVKHIVALIVLAGAGVFLLMRSGNEPLLGVGQLETTLRLKMESLFYARPRTKEFLIGYPLLLAGILWHLRGRKVLGYLGIVGGSVGLASITNTFCHIHIPISLSLLRAFWGVVIGLVIGVILFAIVELILIAFGYSPSKEGFNARDT